MLVVVDRGLVQEHVIISDWNVQIKEVVVDAIQPVVVAVRVVVARVQMEALKYAIVQAVLGNVMEAQDVPNGVVGARVAEGINRGNVKLDLMTPSKELAQ